MIDHTKVLKSSKKIGIHEEVIIKKLSKYFQAFGYRVIPHSRFDLAWGNIISDIDILLIKNDELTLIEVKSSKDNLSRAKKQIAAIKDYVDYVYIATDYLPKKWPTNDTGRIVVQDDCIDIYKESPKIERNPTIDSVMLLKKNALTFLLGIPEKKANNITKYYLASQITREKDPQKLRHELKAIATCNTTIGQNY